MKAKFPRRNVADLIAFDRDCPVKACEPSEPHSIPATTENPHAFEIARLQRAIAGDFRAHPTAYPILARHGFMEYASDGNGYKAIDGEQVINRCRQLIAQLSRGASDL